MICYVLLDASEHEEDVATSLTLTFYIILSANQVNYKIYLSVRLEISDGARCGII